MAKKSKEDEVPDEMKLPDGDQGISPFAEDDDGDAQPAPEVIPETERPKPAGFTPDIASVTQPGLVDIPTAFAPQPTAAAVKPVKFFSKQAGLLVIIEPETRYIPTAAGFVIQTGRRIEKQFNGNFLTTDDIAFIEGVKKLQGYRRIFWPVRGNEVETPQRGINYVSGVATTIDNPLRNEKPD
uniref:Uncharacterized protein n=1 Tax=viral metagenome TaxID=1070528 RepID=A0A6M3ITN3_9ZZZZ